MQGSTDLDLCSQLDKILDSSCQMHGTSDIPANRTNRNCWVFKQADKMAMEGSSKAQPHSEDEDEPRRPYNGSQKQFPHNVKDVNMVYATHTP